jgi:amino acid transporter
MTDDVKALAAPEPSVLLAPTPEELLQGEVAKERLGPWQATAICGNDITSSCLYVSAVVIVYAQALAPLALLLAAGVLYLYRKIYTEVVEVLPLNGGAYNCLLNSTRKSNASFAACLTLLSYLATAVISAKTAAEYLKSLLPFLPPMEVTAAILIVFAGLTILGITDSALVALAIFILHLGALALFIFWSLPVMLQSFQVLTQNWNLSGQGAHWPQALFLGFSAAMLGVSGFESSANYVEQQRPGVFRLTLRNMWLAVTVFNPLIALLALGLLPVPEIVGARNDLVSRMGLMVGGQPLHSLIVVDAFLVLSGAVLTSYVGVSGLVHRMTLDQCLPQVLLKATRRDSYPLIVLLFMALCISILYLTKGQLLSLAGVYTISFLGVMTSFAIGNILLKVNRPELKVTYRASWLTVIVGALATALGIIGNLTIDVRFLWYFTIYFVPALTAGILMYLRIPILKGMLLLIDKVLNRFAIWHTDVDQKIEDITNLRVILFTGLGQMARLVAAFNYIVRNEASQNILILRFYDHFDADVEHKIQENLKILHELFPDMKIAYQSRQGEFNPQTVAALSQEFQVPPNMMFMGSLTGRLKFSFQDLGGVRIIL